MKYKIVFTKQAEKDFEKIEKSTFKNKVFRLLSIIEEDPFVLPYEKLIDLDDTYSRRINIQHRLIYKIVKEENTIIVIRMWTNYGDN